VNKKPSNQIRRRSRFALRDLFGKKGETAPRLRIHACNHSFPHSAIPGSTDDLHILQLGPTMLTSSALGTAKTAIPLLRSSFSARGQNRSIVQVNLVFEKGPRADVIYSPQPDRQYSTAQRRQNKRERLRHSSTRSSSDGESIFMLLKVSWRLSPRRPTLTDLVG
jgi:hypothetical protein